MQVQASFNHVKTLSIPSIITAAKGSSRYKLTKQGELIELTKEEREDIKKESEPKKLKGTVNVEHVRNKINAFYHLHRYNRQFYFYTISFPSGMPDKLAKKALNTWLTRLRKFSKKMSYLWVAERQKNGTIHFHILLNVWYDIQLTNTYMAITINNLITKYELKDINFTRLKYNGVDVQEVKTAKGLSIYLTKYITKSQTSIEGRAWQCSKDISILFTSLEISETEFLEYEQEFTKYSTVTRTINDLNIDVVISYYYPVNEDFTPWVSRLNELNRNTLLIHSNSLCRVC